MPEKCPDCARADAERREFYEVLYRALNAICEWLKRKKAN